MTVGLPYLLRQDDMKQVILKYSTDETLKGLRHEDFAVLGLLCAKINT